MRYYSVVGSLVFGSLLFGFVLFKDHQQSRIYLHSYYLETEVVLSIEDELIFSGEVPANPLSHGYSVKLKKKLKTEGGLWINVDFPEYDYSKKVFLPEETTDYIFISFGSAFSETSKDVEVNGVSRHYIQTHAIPGL